MSRPKDSRVRAPSFVDGGANRGGQSAAQSGMMRVTSKTLSFLTIARECAFPSFVGCLVVLAREAAFYSGFGCGFDVDIGSWTGVCGG